MVSFLLIFYYKLYITNIAQVVYEIPVTTCDSVCCRSIMWAFPTAPAIISKAEPPQRIEIEGYRIRHQSSCHTSDGCRMGADLPPYIDEGANHLYRQRYHYDDTDDARRIAVFHPEKQPK